MYVSVVDLRMCTRPLCKPLGSNYVINGIITIERVEQSESRVIFDKQISLVGSTL